MDRFDSDDFLSDVFQLPRISESSGTPASRGRAAQWVGGPFARSPIVAPLSAPARGCKIAQTRSAAVQRAAPRSQAGFRRFLGVRADGALVARPRLVGHARAGSVDRCIAAAALMATTLRITLLAGTYGVAREQSLDYPPSPWRLLHTLMAAGPDLQHLLARLVQHPPSYHLPYAQVQEQTAQRKPDVLQLGPGAALHISWPVDLSADEERQLSALLAQQHSLGRACDTAIWQVVPSMPEANCVPDSAGTLQVLCCTTGQPANTSHSSLQPPAFEPHWQRYHYISIRPTPQPHIAAASQVNRALYALACQPPLPATAGIAWTDRLHRALLQRAPGSALFSGLLCGQPLPEDQRAWYRWHESEATISLLEVLSPQPFEVVELEALQGLQTLYGHGGMRVPLQLLQLDPQPIASARRLHTITPMLLYTTPRPGKLQRTPAAQAIQSLLWGMGELGKLDPQCLSATNDENAVCFSHPDLGLIRASTHQTSHANLITSRSDRRAASSRAYHAELEAEQPLPLLAVGWGRHFGAGRLEACMDR